MGFLGFWFLPQKVKSEIKVSCFLKLLSEFHFLDVHEILLFQKLNVGSF